LKKVVGERKDESPFAIVATSADTTQLIAMIELVRHFIGMRFTILLTTTV